MGRQNLAALRVQYRDSMATLRAHPNQVQLFGSAIATVSDGVVYYF
jgi:hypothetical protein